MVIAVPDENVGRVGEIADSLDVEMTVLGTFTGDGVLRIDHNTDTVGEIECDFLHNGLPRQHLTARWDPPVTDNAHLQLPADATATLLDLLAEPNIRSKEDIVRRYDHEVQGGTVVKPFAGRAQIGPSDAAVVTPIRQRDGVTPGAALAVGVNPAYGAIDPYRMAWAAVDEAVRNVVAVGADPDRISILDNFSWGNPRIPDRLGSLIRCTQGCYDAAVAYGTPFISGKDSLNNEYTGIDGRKHTIPGTLVISSLGIVPDITRTVSSDLKSAGSKIYLIGATGAHLGGSALAAISGFSGGEAPEPVEALDGYRALHRAISSGLVAACHDISEGGIAVAAAEMAIGGARGMAIALPAADFDSVTMAFSESLGRLLVEVPPQHALEFEETMRGYPTMPLGETTDNTTIRIDDGGGTTLITTTVGAATTAWRGDTV